MTFSNMGGAPIGKEFGNHKWTRCETCLIFLLVISILVVGCVSKPPVCIKTYKSCNEIQVRALFALKEQYEHLPTPEEEKEDAVRIAREFFDCNLQIEIMTREQHEAYQKSLSEEE